MMKLKYYFFKNPLFKNGIYFNFLLIFYLSSLFFVKEMIFLFYNSSDSPDFIRYFTFLESNYDVISYPKSEQGLIFYDFHSYYFYIRNFDFTSENFFIFISKSIQELNFIFFSIGSLGVYKLLNLFKYNKIQILTSLILINFLPISVAQRMIFKPEIFAFALLPWLIFALEKFLITKNIKYLIISVPFYVSLATQKGSIFAMLTLFILIFYFFKIYYYFLKNNFKIFLIVLFVIFSAFLFTTIENNSLTNKAIFDLVSGSQTENKYDNKGSISLIYKINPEKMYFYPYKHLHNQSAIHITLLDSFGDYFDLYWDNDASNFYKSRHELFVFEKSDSIKLPNLNFEKKEITIFVQDDNPTYYIRKTVSVIIATVFFIYFLLFFHKVERKKKKFFIMPYIGYTLLLVHIISGFPENNFDPSVGDTLKPFYYSFFIVIAFAFTVSELIKNKISSILFLTLIIPIFLYIFGFPRNSENFISTSVIETNLYSDFCTTNSYIFNLDMKSDCKKIDKAINKFDDYQNFINFTQKPNFHFFNFLLIVLDLIGISYLQIYKFNLLKNFDVSILNKRK